MSEDFFYRFKETTRREMMSYNKYNDDGSCSNSEYAVDVYVWNQVSKVG